MGCPRSRSFLCIDDSGSEGLHLRAGTVLRREIRHDQGLCVVADHPGDELYVRLGEAHPGAVGPGPVYRFVFGW
jgi:hypothetical protein